ncbi:MAG: hemolysin III family protein [Clostridia bacterium]|nr:hemolysin III family protein [Clostridia bacterium]
MFIVKKKNLLYTLGEEIANSVTHGIGALLAIAACVVLVVTSALTGDPYKIVSCSIYGASLIIMFSMSTLYHALTNEKAKYVFRIFDHTSIFILIAGTYTPIALNTLRGPIGWIIFSIEWVVTIVGIVLNSISIERFKKFSLIAYIVGGWCIVLAAVPFIKSIEPGGMWLILSGGLAYTIGIIFYKLKSLKYMHSLWHLFVLAGAILQYFCIQLYIV